MILRTGQEHHEDEQKEEAAGGLHTIAARAVTRCRTLAAHTEVPGETTRTFLSPPMRNVHAQISAWMSAAGMHVHLDAAGNIHGLFGSPTSPRLLIASHLDTVPNAGAFDGILGVMLGLALVEHLAHPLPTLAIEVIGFSEEEGVRFRKPFLGSMALTGQLESHLATPDREGVTIAEAIRSFGLDPSRLPEARLSPATIAYLEFHIEQGPILEELDLPLAVVSALVGQSRFEFRFLGKANHAGTTPMHLRRDALAAAAQWILEVERQARETSGLVATVGRIEAQPNAGNVIPSDVTVSLDLRHADDGIRAQAADTLHRSATGIARLRHITVTRSLLLEQAAVALDPALTRTLEESARHAGIVVTTLTSGAGHDAMILAPHVPSAMLFLRSPGGGISHHPDESVHTEDVQAALEVGVEFVRNLSAQKAVKHTE